MTTIKAARALDQDHRIGSLERGKEADIALIKLDQLHLVPDAMLISNLVYSSVSTQADTVLVGGQVVLRDGQSTVFDEEEVIAHAREAQIALLQEAGYAGDIGLTVSWPVITQ